jgi:hypothetical protein
MVILLMRIRALGMLTPAEIEQLSVDMQEWSAPLDQREAKSMEPVRVFPSSRAPTS